MGTEQAFDNRLSSLVERRAALARATSALTSGDAPAPAPAERNLGLGSDAIPLLAPLAPLAPAGLERGEVTQLDNPGGEPDHLTVALLAGAMREGLWCATVGLPQLGGAALAEMVRADGGPEDPLRTLLTVPDPGEAWPEVTAALAESVDLVVLRLAAPASAAAVRQVSARLRQRGGQSERRAAALAVLGRWGTARLVLRVESREWAGLHGDGQLAGTGHLTAGRMRIAAEDRARRRRSVEVWLPAADGSCSSVEELGAVSPLRRRVA